MELSPQQSKIVELILRGRKDKEIATALGLQVPTVRTYLGRIFARTGVGSRVELVLRVVAMAYGFEDRAGRHQD